MVAQCKGLREAKIRLYLAPQLYQSHATGMIESKHREITEGTLMQALGMEFVKVEDGYLEATMPVDSRTHQPYGLLHGGASAALAESLGSYGSHLMVAPQGGLAVGVELNINHLKSKRSGWVRGKARIIHRGRSSHVWQIDIVDEKDQLLAVSRLTVLVKQGEK